MEDSRMVIGSDEYRKAVDAELVRCDDELRALHHGDVRYVALLEKMDPAQAKTLAAIPDQIQALIGVAPLTLFFAATNFLLASHRLAYEVWSAREAVGLEVFARLAAGTGKVV
jgi:hypothetical protein